MTPEYLALRRDRIVEAVDRFNAGVRLPRPELPPLVISYPVQLPKAPRGPRVRRYDATRNSLATGDLAPGTVVASGQHLGRVMGFLPPGVDPAAYIPAGLSTRNLGGHHRHGPAQIARYVVAIETSYGTVYHCPKATTVERWAMEQAS